MPPPTVTYEIHPYSHDTLRDLFAAKAQTDPSVIDAKLHLVYFQGYCDRLAAKTIVVENEYIDRDYLEDFAAYYVRCFASYNRKCCRLHFFSAGFDETAFEVLLAGQSGLLSEETLRSEYLGFIVVKPLPQTVVGRTCLRTYPSESHRHFPITRTYDANLFGLQLSVESLGYQEQDSVAAACATSALWAAFQGTGKQFQHHIPSPVEITRTATAHVPLDTRTFPNNDGLTITQMADGIRGVGLEPYLIPTRDEFVLRSTLYAYLRGHIPVLLTIELYDPYDPVDPNTGLPEPMALHEITVAGYSLAAGAPVPYRGSTFCLRAFRMEKIYVHDDQVGPFARMRFLHETHFDSSWTSPFGAPWNAHASAMLIPLYHKIRIPFQNVFDIVVEFDNWIGPLNQAGMLPLGGQLEWDLYLTTVNDFKGELQLPPGDYRRTVLTRPMPRFMWRATAYDAGNPALELLFDATDIEQGTSFVGAIAHNRALARVLQVVALEMIQQPLGAAARLDHHVVAWLANPRF